MSLNVYTRKEDIPKGMILVSDNDSYFSGETLLSGSDFCKLVLRNIDKAEYVSEFCFTGRTKEFGNLNKDLLSTGTKTLLNIESSPDLCFNAIECGYNAISLLPLIKEGNILMPKQLYLYDGRHEDCDISCNNMQYSIFSDFLSYLGDVLR